MNLDSAVLYSNDIQKSVDFFHGLLGLKIEYRREEAFVCFIFDNEVRLSVKKPVREREVPGKQTIFIQSNNAKADYEKFKKFGVTFISEYIEQPWGNEFSIADPDDNKILFMERM
jgi:predicted enzyme related to lactoylglutathione lyase